MSIKRQLHSMRTRGFVRSAASVIVALILVLTPLSPSFHQQKAEAGILGNLLGNLLPQQVIDPTNIVQTTATAVNTGSLQLKEFTLDGIANSLMKQAVRQMTTSIVQWINTGFQGSPAFVTDLGGFLKDVADNVAGQFIEGSQLGFLCSPFELNIRAALEIQYNQTFEQQSACTLSDVLNNAENIGDAMSGWDDWFSVTTVPQNNQYGAYMLAQQELDSRLNSAEQNKRDEINQGRGFLSLRSCTTVNGQQQCKVVTPGSVISSQLVKSLGAGQDTLISADEINEVISALFGQLAQQAITGSGGLLGLSSGNNGDSSYLNQVNGGGGGNNIGYTDNSNNLIGSQLTIERDILDIYQDVANMIDDATGYADNLNCSVALPSTLKKARDDVAEALPDQQQLVFRLQLMNASFSSNSSQSDVYQNFLQLQSSGAFHTQSDVDDEQAGHDTIETEVNDYMDEIKSQCT